MHYDTNKEYSSEKEEFVLGEIRALLDKLPKNTVLILNLPRYKEVCSAISKINGFVKDISPDAEFSARFDDLVGTCLLYTITADELSITKTKQFAEAIAVSNTMSVVPLTNGNIEIGFTFEDVRIPAPSMK